MGVIRNRAFFWLNRSFWMIWLAFPVWIGLMIREILTPLGSGAAGVLPRSIADFTPLGQFAFWSVFMANVAFFAAVLALAHRVVRSCAEGQVFIPSLARILRRIGAAIALYPLADLLLMNLSAAVYAATGDVAAFVATYDLDLTVLGVGLLLLTMATAMDQAVALQRDADLTI